MTTSDDRPDLHIGTILHCTDISQYRDNVVLADELGYEVIGNGENPLRCRELYVCLGMAASLTKRAHIGPMVTNPVMRHDAVTASSMATLDAWTGGRAVLGFGAGGGPRHAMKLQVTREEIGQSITTIRTLLAGGPSPWEDRPLTFPAEHPVPVVLSAYGPRTARLGGEVADAVLWAGGHRPEVLARAKAEIREGAHSAGRNPADVQLWVLARAAIADSRREALVGIRGNLASAGGHGLRSEVQLETVPLELRDRMRGLQAGYSEGAHLACDGPNALLMDELGLTDYLGERFAIAGTPDEVRAQAHELAAQGVSHLLCPATDRDPDRFLTDFAAAVRL